MSSVSKTGRESNANTTNRTSPNVVMITCHDIGQHVGCYGVDTVHTPNIDGLAEKGIRFANYYSSSSVCSPARGSFHTGRYPQSNGLMGLTHSPWWWRLNDDEKHTAQFLAEAGYDTCLIGFKHIHRSYQGLGYHEHLSPRNNADETVKAARQYIDDRSAADDPFFAKIGFTQVHRRDHWQRDDDNGVFIPGYLQDTPRMKHDLAQFQGSIRYFDDCVGRILQTIERGDVADNTIVIFTADHGIPYPGAKWTARTFGLQVPLVMYQPRSVLSGGRVFQQLMSNVDLLPTILDLAELPISNRIQGISYKDVIEENAQNAPRDAVFGQYTPEMKRDNQSRSITTENYQLIRYFDAGRSVKYPVDVHPQDFAAHVERAETDGTRPFCQLYNLKEDPWQLNDIGREAGNAQIVEDLSGRLLEWMQAVDDPLLHGPLRYPYYDRAMEDFVGEQDI